MSEQARFDPIATARTLLRTSSSGALATLTPASGDPYCSLVNVATEPSGAPILLISRLALHTKNILNDSRVSLLLDERDDGDPMALTRIMIAGRAERIEAAAGARQRYLARHPDAEGFVDFPDFGFFRIRPASVHLVAGFGRINDIRGPDLLTDLAGCEALVDAAADAVAHMNRDHADAVRLYATKLLGAPDGDWRLTGVDPDGADLMLGRRSLRLAFPTRVSDPAVLRKTLVALAAQARTKG